jgi:hypothetical protein
VWGLKDPQAELTFPISSQIILWASWNYDLVPGYFDISKDKFARNFINEINNRIIGTATRYVFHATREEWIWQILSFAPNKLHPKRIIGGFGERIE